MVGGPEGSGLWLSGDGESAERLGDRLDAAIADSGLTLSQLRERLRQRGVKVSLSTLSYWRSGQRRPEGAASYEAVHVLEELLDLEPGHLLDVIGPSRRRGLERPRVGVSLGLPQGGGIVDVVAGLGLAPWWDELDDVSTHAVVTVPDEGPCRLEMRQVFRARRHGVSSVPNVHLGERPTEGPPAFVALGGCRIGRTVADPRNSLCAVELLFDRPLALHETVLVEYAMTFPPDDPPTRMWHYLERRTPELVLVARFGSRVPTRCLAEQEVGGGTRSRPLALEGRQAHLALQDFGPGLAGIRWSDPD